MGENFWGLLSIAMFGLSLGLFLGSRIERADWKAEMINRGISQYCPDTGEFAWKGECK